MRNAKRRFRGAEGFDFRGFSRLWLAGRKWSEWQDLNLRPLRPERSALPD